MSSLSGGSSWKEETDLLPSLPCFSLHLHHPFSSTSPFFSQHALLSSLSRYPQMLTPLRSLDFSLQRNPLGIVLPPSFLSFARRSRRLKGLLPPRSLRRSSSVRPRCWRQVRARADSGSRWKGKGRRRLHRGHHRSVRALSFLSSACCIEDTALLRALGRTVVYRAGMLTLLRPSSQLHRHLHQVAIRVFHRFVLLHACRRPSSGIHRLVRSRSMRVSRRVEASPWNRTRVEESGRDGENLGANWR